MIIKEVRQINGKEVNYTYSDTGAVLRCGRLRFADAADPIGVDKDYFEEGVEPEPAKEDEANGD